MHCAQVYPKADELREHALKAYHPARGWHTPLIVLHGNGLPSVQVKGAGAARKKGFKLYSNTVFRGIARLGRSILAAEDELVQRFVNERSGAVLIVYTVHGSTPKYFDMLATFVGIDDRFFYLALEPPAVQPQPQTWPQPQTIPANPPPQRQVQKIVAPALPLRQVQLVAPSGQPGAGRVKKRKVELPSRGACQCWFDKHTKGFKSKQNEKPRSRMLVTASR